MKGRRPDDELAALPTGFALESLHALAVPGLEGQRHLAVIRHAGAA
jgi:16S rRNA (guanine527-N7)-methyltransferase